MNTRSFFSWEFCCWGHKGVHAFISSSPAHPFNKQVSRSAMSWGHSLVGDAALDRTFASQGDQYRGGEAQASQGPLGLAPLSP